MFDALKLALLSKNDHMQLNKVQRKFGCLTRLFNYDGLGFENPQFQFAYLFIKEVKFNFLKLVGKSHPELKPTYDKFENLCENKLLIAYDIQKEDLKVLFEETIGQQRPIHLIEFHHLIRALWQEYLKRL